ncbi:uncharacterized protein LOC111705930 isoform X2 [Eurytemora carolleeae]|uniref:uncharacterized protein LOC111705930 isoform X2 n=1 Tax=Eurytemora carolleeae TaxID=1294199 RepID=UPI000C77DC62|nr:uncharacterized protein LOC111705930 isoform X2 [Eurytemora carolleeae]|eukprot:XP_023334408.1 uncharacterized protein LOC111705930 isoform X2 [Eurytemora affinis]
MIILKLILLHFILVFAESKTFIKGFGDFECPGPGIWADPANCQCYYNCANSIPYHTCCSDGTYFDAVYMDCDYEDKVDCGSRPEPGGSTRPPTTTTATSTTTIKTSFGTTTTSPTTTSTTTIGTSFGTTTISTTTIRTSSGTTSTSTTTSGPYPGFPNKVLGLYILLADDTETGYGTNEDWEPLLYPYQQTGANVLFFTFINPATMEIPLSFKKLASTRGTNTDGAVPKDTLIIFAIGGYQYSIDPNPWQWLTSKQAAEDMAVQVARWRDDYGIDGIDLDIEEGAGGQTAAGPNLLHFIRKLKSIHPDLLVSQPTYGYPQVKAESDVINGSWKPGGDSTGLADSIGLMVYEGTQALIYVKNYAAGSSQWDGFPIKVDVPKPQILLGCKGSSNPSDILSLAEESGKQDLMGIMVWYSSVRNGLKYAESWDSTGRTESEEAYTAAMEYFAQFNARK